ncbi:kelch-like protein [Corallococcus sp. CA041A]|uniref:Kelch repeat-containing protein n=1 Tax=Corallococcus sp. CA041A TaxID=2316727 RepID=UPI000EA3EADE|nr:kelch repeat-containing protein [Corallococcus sp. CA041A]RKH29603.1 kelch-like protein [Corallococcus sp. CA041A]
MNKTSRSVVLALTLALLAGCAGSSSDTGSARFAVSVRQALASGISRVTVTSSAPDIPSVTVDLAPTHGVWGGVIGNIPAGPNRTFLARAFDASGILLFEGSASGITISANQTALVAITLQEANPPPPFDNEAPLIDSLVASSTSVPVGGSLSLVATAHDPNPGDTLSYAWSATAGSFSSPSAASTSWTAPLSTGIQTLTFTVTDSRGLSSSIVLDIYVSQEGHEGEAQLSISFNSSPRVASLIATPTQLAVGQPTAVSVCASDPDGDSLSYSWSATCAGSWSNASSHSAQFTPSLLPVGPCNNCRLTVTVSDGRGGLTTGTVALCVRDTPPANHFPPVIIRSYRSSDTATPGQVLTYEVVASDPEGSALTFSWQATTGVPGTPASDASRSRVTWTAPACVSAGTPPTVTVTVTNAFNLTDTRSFEVTGLPTCTPSGVWVPTGSMIQPRSGHTATLLPNGTVLVAGGTSNGAPLATAEVYDPVSGTWGPTGSLAQPRSGHSATLLPNGKVLVVGGRDANGFVATAELYDPASGTWSPASSPLASGPSSATLLLNGKVLVAGGTTPQLYDPASDTWSFASAPLQSASSGETRLLDGKVLFARKGASQLYDPVSDTWSATNSPAVFPGGPPVTLLPDGKVLAAGGYDPTVDLVWGGAELYDPASGTWTLTAPMGGRVFYTATLLTNGKVLVAGGSAEIFELEVFALATATLYDPVSGTWSPTGSMAQPRYNHTATLLPNGTVLVTGGSVPTAELYLP